MNIQAKNGIEVIVNLANYEGEKYTNVDIEYTINASNDNYDIAIKDEAEGVLAGEEKNTTRIVLTATPKENVELNPEETITIEITTKKPYVETKTIEIKIDTLGRYTVEYDANGGENAPEAQEKLEDEDLELDSTIPTRRGYNFLGWATTADATTPEYSVGVDSHIDPPYTENADATLYAVWEIEEYTITYNLNDGVIEGTNPDTYTIESEDITLINPRKEGYTFTGWTGSNGALPEETITIAAGSTGDRLYTANWELKVPTVELVVENAEINLFDNVTTTFTANVTDTAEETYQWYYNGNPIEGATTNTYSIATEDMTESNYKGGEYKVVITNNAQVRAVSVEYSATQTVARTVGTAEQMKNFAARVNEQLIRFVGDTVEQTANIDLSTVCGVGNNWVPIGTYVNTNDYFSGVYDGKEFEVTNLYINNTDKTYRLGLFGVFSGGATVQNLTVKGEIATNQSSAAAGIVGHLIGKARNCKSYVNITGVQWLGGITGTTHENGVTVIENCTNYGTITADLTDTNVKYIGGIVGVGYATIQNCINYGAVTGNYSGGIAGNTNATTQIINCINNAEIKGNNIGGITYSNLGTILNSTNNATINVTSAARINIYGAGVVCSNNGLIEHCVNTGNVTGIGTAEAYGVVIGGIIALDNTNSVVKNSYNSGNISADCQHNASTSSMSCAGGIVGYLYKNGTIENCYNTGDISSNKKQGGNSNNVGGIVAYENCASAIVKNCYSTGNIVGTREDGKTSFIGGVIGQNNGNGSISNNYYLQNSATGGINGADVTGSAEVRTSAYMKTDEFVTLLGAENWKIVSGKNEGYPVFGWQYETYSITYELNGGTVEGTNPSNYMQDSEDITLINPTKEGYTFIGWTGSNGDIPQETVVITSGSTGTKTYTANWEPKTVKVKFIRNFDSNDTTSVEKTYTYGVDGQAFSDNGWSKDEYVLSGWAHSQNATVTNYSVSCKVSDDWISKVSEEVWVWAVWEEAYYYNETEDKYYVTLADAMSGSATGSTIKPIKNAAETKTATVASNKELTLDLNGYTISYSGTSIFRINNTGILTVKGSGKITDSTGYTLRNSGTLNIKMNEDGIIENTGTGRPMQNSESGVINVYSGTIQATCQTENQQYAIYSTSPTATINVIGGRIRGTEGHEYLSGILLYGNANISGGLIESNLRGITVKGSGNLNITGGTINSIGEGNTVYFASTGTFHITGEKEVKISSNSVNAIYNSSEDEGNGTIVINNPNAIIKGKRGIYMESGSVNVIEGTITGDLQGIHNISGTTITIGTEDGEVSTTSPSIKGTTYGVQMESGILNFYDGVITGAIAINGEVADKPEGYSVVVTEENNIETAILSNEYEVTYEYNGATGENTEESKVVTYGNTYGLLPNPEKKFTVSYETNGGESVEPDTVPYTFGGWYKESELTNEVTSDTRVEISNHHTIYARWTQGMIQRLPSTTKAGYVIEGWYETSDFSGTKYAVGATYTSNKDTTLYANWSTAYYYNETEDEHYVTLAEATTGSATGSTIKVIRNATETTTATVASGKNITLDLGGKTVSYSGINGIENAGTLTVVGSGKITDTAGCTINNTGTLNVNTDNETSYNDGTGGIIENTSGLNVPRAIHNNGIIYINSGIVANSATAEAVTAAQSTSEDLVTPYAIVNGYNGTLNIKGGIIRSISSDTYPQSGLYSTGILNMSGGLVESVATTMTVTSSGSATITGGTIKAGGVNETYGGIALNHTSTGTLDISGTNNILISARIGQGIYNGSTGTVNISNPNLTVNAAQRAITNNVGGNIVVNGGTYTQTSTASGNCIINIASGKITINDGNFTSLAQSSCAYNNNAGIIEINGGNLSAYSGITNNRTGEIIINGGTIEGTGNQAILNNSTGTITITGGTIKGNRYGLNGASTSAGFINITGGTITAQTETAIYGSWNTVTIGSNDGTVSTTSPSITGSTDGVNVGSGTFNFYDGVIKGKTAINGTVSNIPDGYSVKTTTANSIQTAILQPDVEVTNQEVNLFDDVTTTFTTNVVGSSYQWYYNDTPISGATSNTYSISTTEMTESNYKGGTYKVVVTTESGTVEATAEQTVKREVGTATQMKNFATRVNTQGITFAGDTVTQTANIDLSSVCGVGNNWVPIGTYVNTNDYFSGVYDGKEFEVTNLYINNTDQTYRLGLFGLSASVGTVQNLTVKGEITTTKANLTGGVAGQIMGRAFNCKNYVNITGVQTIGGIAGSGFGTIENCINYGNITGNNSGGIIGGTNASTQIKNCTNNATIKGQTIGGISYNNYGIINNCINNGVVSATTSTAGVTVWAGGISCLNVGTIENCANLGNVIGQGTEASFGVVLGGITARDYNSASIIKKCYNEGAIESRCLNITETSTSAFSYAGGILGLSDYSGTVENCYNTGNITAYNAGGGGANIAGGIIAYIPAASSSKVRNCYNIGDVSGTRGDSKISHVGGTIGHNTNGTITNCYYLQDSAPGGINGADVTGSAEVRVATYMQSSNFVDLLGNTNWKLVKGVNDNYPVLMWQEGTAYTNYTYEQDGLILWYDAIDNQGTGTHSTTATTWTDLSSSGNDGILSTYHTFGANSLNCQRTTGAYSITTNPLFTTEPESYTIEIVAKINNTSNSWFWCIRDTNARNGIQLVNYYNESTGETYYHGLDVFESLTVRDTYDLSDITNSVFNRSVTYEKAADTLNIYDNSENVISNNPTAQPTLVGQKLQFGGISWHSSMSLDGAIYSIRVYDRALTAEEVQHNYEIDKARFNLE